MQILLLYFIRMSVKPFEFELKPRYLESTCEMIISFLKLAIPSMICAIVFSLQHTVNMVVAGHLSSTSLLASIGLGNMIQNCFFVAPIWGINSAIEILASLAAGANNQLQAREFHDCGKIVLFGIMAIEFIVGLQTERILLVLGQDEDVSKQTHEYIMWYFPALFVFGITDLQRKFLNSFRKNLLPLASFIVCVGIHPFWCYYLAISLDMKL